MKFFSLFLYVLLLLFVVDRITLDQNRSKQPTEYVIMLASADFEHRKSYSFSQSGPIAGHVEKKIKKAVVMHQPDSRGTEIL